jgi:hypothetical protein
VASRWTQAATILPPTLEVCGRRLLPFCLRHRVALEAIDSPVLETSKPLSVADLILAVRVLSTTDTKSLPSKPSLREKWWAARLRYNEELYIQEVAKLLLYFEAQSLWPRFWEKQTKAKDNGVPWPLAIVANLMRNGCSFEDAWTMPESEAVWLHIAHITSAGANVQIVSDDEWNAMEACKREEAEKKKQTNPRN